MGATAKIKAKGTGGSGGSSNRDSGAETVSLLSKMLGKLGILSVLLSLKPVVDLIAATIGLIAFYLFKFFSMWPAFADYFKNLFSGGTNEGETGYTPLDALGEALKGFDVGKFFLEKVPNAIKDFGKWVLENLILNPIKSWMSFVLGLLGNPEPFDIIKFILKKLGIDTGGDGGSNGGSSAVVGGLPFTTPTGGQSSPSELDTFAYISNALANGIIGGNSSIGHGAGGGGTFNFYGMTTDEVVDRVQSVVRLDVCRAPGF